MSLDIKVSGVSLELFPNEEDNFYITKQLHDLRDLQTRNATFSKKISVPNVRNNSYILRQYLPEFSHNVPTDIDFLSVDVYIDDVPVIEDAILFSTTYNRTDNEIDITILGGGQDFFNQLSDDPISILFDEVIEWSQSNLLLNTLNGSFWVYPNLNWFNNESYELFDAVNSITYDQFSGVNDPELSGFVLYCKEIWQRIMGNLIGLTADETWFNTYFSQLGIGVPVYQFLDSYGKVAGFSAAVSNAPGTPINTIDKIKFATTDVDPNSLWQPSPDFKFIVATTALGKIIVDLTVEVWPQPVADTNTNYIRLYKNGIVIQEWILPYNSEQTQTTVIQWQTITYLDALDELWLEAETASNVFGTTKFDYTDDKFQLIFGLSPTEVTISDVVPEISQKNFVKSILNQMHLLPVVVGDTVLFSFWEDIINESPNLLTDKVAVDQTISESSFLSNYGQSNWFVYQDDDNVERTDMNSFLPVLNKTLKENVTKIELPYSASDETIAPTLLGAALYGKATVPSFSFEYQEITGNKIRVNSGGTAFSTASPSDLAPGDIVVIRRSNVTYRMRVQIMTSPTAGNFKFPWPSNNSNLNWQLFKYETNDVGIHILTMKVAENISIQNGDGAQPAVIGARSGFFEDTQKWSSLLTDYYLLFSKSIEKPWVATVFVYLTVAEFNTLNSLSPIWLNEVGDYFYINKIEQFKKNKLTRVELIRLYSEPI